MHVNNLAVKLNAPSYYLFKMAPRRLSIKHLNNGAAKTPDVNSKIIANVFNKYSLNKLQKKKQAKVQ
jgi:hypothetical protein